MLVSNVSMSRWSDPETGSYAAATSARQISPMGWKPSFTGITWGPGGGVDWPPVGVRVGVGVGIGSRVGDRARVAAHLGGRPAHHRGRPGEQGEPSQRAVGGWASFD